MKTKQKTGKNTSGARLKKSLTARLKKFRMNIQPNALKHFNLQTLKKLDIHIKSLVLSGGQVTAYIFDSETRIWDSMPVNGPIFIVEREHPYPRYSFLILNRSNIKTLDVEITNEWMLEDTETILICQPNDNQLLRPEVYGLWFHDKNMKGQFYKTIIGIMANNKILPIKQEEQPRSISLSELFQSEIQPLVKQESNESTHFNNFASQNISPVEENGKTSNLVVKDIQSFLNEFNPPSAVDQKSPSSKIDLKNIETSSLSQPQFFQSPMSSNSPTKFVPSNQSLESNKNTFAVNKFRQGSASLPAPQFFQSSPTSTPPRARSNPQSPTQPLFSFNQNLDSSRDRKKKESFTLLQAQLQSQLQEQIEASHRKTTGSHGNSSNQLQLYTGNQQPQQQQLARVPQFPVQQNQVQYPINSFQHPQPQSIASYQQSQQCMQTISTTTTTHTVNHSYVSANHSLMQLQYGAPQTATQNHHMNSYTHISNASEADQQQFRLVPPPEQQLPEPKSAKKERKSKPTLQIEIFPRVKQESNSPPTVPASVSTPKNQFKSGKPKNSEISNTLQSQLQFRLQSQLQSQEML